MRPHDRLSILELPTPLVRAASLSTAGRDAYLKNETVLPTGSFKVRGALHALRACLARQPIGEVIAASTGNHGAAVAWAARSAGVGATIFVPEHANPLKVARIRELGAQLVETGADLSAATDAAYAYADRTGAFFLHDAADPDVPAGTAQIGEEIVAQQPAVTRIYVPMGDTALIRGVASAAKRAKPSVTVVGVAAANAPAYLLSWQQGRVVETETPLTIADGLAVSRPLMQNVTAIRALVDEVLAVTEAEMLAAIGHLRREEAITAEPAGAAAVAAYLKDGSASAVNVLLVTGANIAPAVAARV
ncbi:MAG TPA: pyridoxal-phosphate dependent enzyme [Vicinamibacterales bacterium]|nr:pyridoxal-phosphate dependent enzyme [Vicinamibacterales bacterium]